MFDEEAARKKPSAYVVGQELAPLSIEEIDLRLAELAAEMERLRSERARKEAVKGAADALFRKA